MTQDKDDFTLLVEFFRKCRAQGPLSGSGVTLELPQAEDDSLAQYLVSINIIKPVAGHAKLFNFQKIPNFFWSVDDFLLKPERRIKPPKKFYVADQDWYSTERPKHELSGRYEEVLKLFDVLKKVAAHEDTNGNDLSLIILHKEKLIIDSKYSLIDMQELVGLDQLDNEFVNSDTHQEKKRNILKTILIEMYAGREKIEIGQVIKDFGEILSRLGHGYDLFVSDFSFNKIKSEVERDKLEFTTRLNKVFSDIQNQLLAVPAALLLVGSQMKKVEPVELQLSNIAIWLGAVLFFILIELLIRNQRNTLQAVKSEVDLQKEIFKEHHQAVYEKFKNVYVELNNRFDYQCRLLWFIRSLVGAVLGFTTGMLVWYSSDSIGYAAISGVLLTIVPIGLALLINDFSGKENRKKE